MATDHPAVTCGAKGFRRLPIGRRWRLRGSGVRGARSGIPVHETTEAKGLAYEEVFQLADRFHGEAGVVFPGVLFRSSDPFREYHRTGLPTRFLNARCR